MDCDESFAMYVEFPGDDKSMSGAEVSFLSQTQDKSVSTKEVLLPRSRWEDMGNALSGDIILTGSHLSRLRGSDRLDENSEGMLFSQSPLFSIGSTLFDDIDCSPVHCAQLMKEKSPFLPVWGGGR